MNQAAFALLNPGVQRAIWELGWKQLRPIQAETIRVVLQSDDHALICAATASGKTEAAFLPIISKLMEGAKDSIRSIYIGPLKALINDQFARLDHLCERLDISVHRWHGDVSAAHKQQMRSNPSGILLITPESLESNFINYGSLVPRLYRDLDYVVVDEVHSFLGNVRGVHLLSLLSRLRTATRRQPRMIGLSATLGDPESGKQFLASDNPSAVRLIEDNGPRREIKFALKAVLKRPDARHEGNGAARISSAQALEFVKQKSVDELLAAGESPTTHTNVPATAENAESPDELEDITDDVVQHFATSTNLVFVNSRRTSEELAVRVHDRVSRLKWPRDPFVIHHGSVAKEVREDAEAALKSGVPTTAICSSTLELGIDIGSVRAVGQIDPPWSVASLVQRLGRSGRREGESSIMRLYVREESPHSGSRITDLLFPDLLRGMALTRLMQQKWLEPADTQKMDLSTLVHQVFSHLKQTGGMTAASLFQALAVAGPFRSITPPDFALLIRGLGSKQLVEQMPTGELILAPAGEQITAAHDFYAAFKSSEMFTVRHEKAEIGELPFDALPPAGQLVILAGRRWLVTEIDSAAKTVWVLPAHGGKIPVFLGNGGDLHTRVVQEMKTVLFDDDEPPYLDSQARDLLRAARHVATSVKLQNLNVLATPGGVRWFPWVGTRCLRTLSIMAELSGTACETDRLSLWLPIQSSNFVDFAQQLANAAYAPEQLGLRVTPRAVEKFDEFLPEQLLTRACVTERLSIDQAKLALANAFSPGADDSLG